MSRVAFNATETMAKRIVSMSVLAHFRWNTGDEALVEMVLDAANRGVVDNDMAAALERSTIEPETNTAHRRTGAGPLKGVALQTSPGNQTGSMRLNSR